MSLAGARLLVVGASSGIGQGIAARAVAAGADVAFAARRRARLAEAVTDAGGGHPVRLDVCDGATIPTAVATAADALGGLDIVVHAAGIAKLARLADADATQWREALDTNVVGPALVTRAALEHLGHHGIVLFCSSTNVEQPRLGLGTYGASKAAADRAIESFRTEHPRIRFVRAVLGETVGTEFGDTFDRELLDELLATWVLRAETNAGLMHVEDVSAAIVDLLTTLRATPRVDVKRIDIEPAGGKLALPSDPDLLARALETFIDAISRDTSDE